MSAPGSAAPSPGASTSHSASDSAPAANLTDVDRLVLSYLRTRGHNQAVQALQESIQDPDPKGKSAVTSEDLLKSLAVFASTPNRPAENTLKDGPNVLRDLASLGNPPNIQNLLATIGAVGAEEVLTLDPLDKQEGFRELEAWVDGSLDMYRPEFRAILFPIFCHFYLDLVQYGFKDAAVAFYRAFASSMAPAHSNTLHHLATLLLPSHVQNDEVAQRFRNEKYAVRMSRSGFDLLVGWLTEGIGGEPAGVGGGFTGERGKRGRAAVMRVVNNHLRFDVTTSTTTSLPATVWEESTGLISSLIPQAAGTGTYTNPAAFNRSRGELKLGPLPLSDELKTETERVLREQSLVDRDPAASYDLALLQAPPPPGAPTVTDLPPHPPAFKSVDVKREVERVRDARKKIRLEPSALASVDMNGPQAAAARARALPSVCAYTIHNAPEGVPCCTFSPDTSLMAAGFAESYIRLWSLKGEKLKGMRSDFQASNIRDPSSIRKIREKGGSTSRKLIGHSGAVYALSFDPCGGSAAPPRYLLSASADATARLWSLDTMTNVVAYRGHQNPVWDAQWSPMGVYFATASRDRTARLWSTDRTSALRVYAGHLSDVDTVRFHPNSLYIATGSSDWTARLWDVQKGTAVRVFIGHQGAVSSLAFSPDGRYLASAGEDLAINLWDLGSGRRIKKMTGHRASIYSLAFSQESSMLVSGGADWTLRCWDVKSAGGPASKMANGLANGHVKTDEESFETSDLLTTFPTKRTPLINVQFTPRNLLLSSWPVPRA